MGSARETLRETAGLLSEAEAAKALDYIRRLRGGPAERALAELLSEDPAIHLPSQPFASLPDVESIAGAGIPASELLIRDRR